MCGRQCRPGCQCRGLERARDGGANRHHAAAGRTGGRDRRHRRRFDLVALAVHHMSLERLAAQRLEGARPHVQRDQTAENPPRRQRRQQCLVEMQACGRRRHRAGDARPQALIALLVERVGSTLDIGRQRHQTVRVEERHRLGRQFDFPERGAPGDQPHLPTAGLQRHPQPHRLAVAQLYQRPPALQRPLEKQLNTPAAGLACRHARRYNPGIVEHQQIAGRQQRR